MNLNSGDVLENGEKFEILIRRGSWFGAKVNDVSSYSLVGCTAFPAFKFEDFQLADRKTLAATYPGYKDTIEMLTKSLVEYDLQIADRFIPTLAD